MKLSVRAKSLLAKSLASFRIPEGRIRSRSGKQYLILMYHRVIPSEDAASLTQAGMYVDPRTFEEHIRYLRFHFHIISFCGKFLPPEPGHDSRPLRPECILTFDDGWSDFYEHAYPVLARNGVPATVFLPTGFIGTRVWFWSDRLAWHLRRPVDSAKPATGEAISGDAVLQRIAGLAGPFEERLEAAIGFLKHRREEEIERVVETLSLRDGAVPVPDRRAFLNWEEIREMKGSGLITFGSHTHNHRILVHLDEQEIRDEVVRSREALLREAAVDPAFIPFCYPNGDWDERVARIVRDAGYHATVSAGSGWNEEGASPFGLKRVAIHQDMTVTREMFGCRVADIL